MQNLTNISNYLGEHKTGTDYQKFDFVFNKVDGLYYYAKNDIPWQDPSIISETNRFTLDPNGPIWGGRQTFYLFDAQNNLPNFIKHGSLIQIEGSIYNNDGSYKVIGNPKVNYSPNNAVAGDYVLSELLNGVEGSLPDWFVSDWFLLGENNFYWDGRDFEAYVNNHQDLLNYYTVNVQGLTKEEWGKIHYTDYGEAENRSLPIKNNGNWFYHPLLKWVYIPVSASQTDPLDKSFWFKLTEDKDAPANKFWFWTKQSWAGTNNDAYIAYEDEGGIQLDYSVEDENTTFTDPDVRELDASADGNTLLVRTDTGIKRYENESGSWNQKASLSFDGTFRYLACDGSCDTIAVFGYENRYYKLTKDSIEVPLLGGGMIPLYPEDNLTTGLPWETIDHSGPINQVYEDASTEHAEYYIAGDVYIYKYNSTSQSFELQHTIEKMMGMEMTADFDLSGNTLCIFEPMGLVGYHYIKKIGYYQSTAWLTFQNSRQIKNYSFNGLSWGRSLTCVFCQPHRHGIFIGSNQVKGNRLSKAMDTNDEHYIADFIKQGKAGDPEAKNGQVLAFIKNEDILVNQYSQRDDYFIDTLFSSYEMEPFNDENKNVALSGDGKRIFWISSNDYAVQFSDLIQNANIKYIEFNNEWSDSTSLIELPGGVYPKETRGILGVTQRWKYPERTGSKSTFSIKTNYHGNAIACYGRYESGNDQQIYDAFSGTNSTVSSIIEDTMIEVNGEWQYKELVIEGPKYDYRYKLTNLMMSKNSEGKTRVAGIIGQKQSSRNNYDYRSSIIHPKRYYDLEYWKNEGYFKYKEIDIPAYIANKKNLWL